MDGVGVISMVPRERADAEGAQELVLVEHLRQHAAELVFAQDRSEPATANTELHRVVDGRVQFGTVGEKPLQPAN